MRAPERMDSRRNPCERRHRLRDSLK